MKKIVYLSYTLIISTTLFIGNVIADEYGVCTYRPLNKSETEFFSKYSILRSSVPTAPDGWSLRNTNNTDPNYSGIPDQVCAESTEHKVTLNILYEKNADVQKDQGILNRAINAAPGKDDMSQIEALQAKQMELALQATTAAEKGDLALVDKINIEINAIVEEIQKKFDAMNAPSAEIAAEFERDRSASLVIAINSNGGDCSGNPQPVNIPGVTAYRCAYEKGYTPFGEVIDHAFARTLVVIGKTTTKKQEWPRIDKDQREFTDHRLNIEAAYDRAQPLVVQNVVISIDSDNPERVDGLLRGLHLDPLKKLVKH